MALGQMERILMPTKIYGLAAFMTHPCNALSCSAFSWQVW